MNLFKSKQQTKVPYIIPSLCDSTTHKKQSLVTIGFLEAFPPQLFIHMHEDACMRMSAAA